MDEGDLQPEQPGAWLGIDQLGARLRETRERRTDVVDLVGHVVHAGPATREELADGRVLTGRREQLDPPTADQNGRRVDALLLDAGTVLQLGAEQPAIRVEGLVEVLDGDAEMMNAPWVHPRRC